MAQAIGAQARIAFCEESTWGTTPATPSMKLLKAATYGESLGGDIAELMSNSINSSRAVDNVRGGNISVKGALPFELAPLGLGTLLKHALGSKTTTGTNPYTHVLKRGALPAGLSIEKGFVDLGQYFVFRGCKVNQLSLSIAPGQLITGSVDVMGKDFSANVSQLGAPTSVTHSPFAAYEIAAQEGGSGATLLNCNLTLTNAISDTNALGSRYVASLAEGKGECTFDLTAMFDSMTLFNKWLNETQSSLKLTATQGANSIELYMPAVKYIGDAMPKIANAQGVVVALKGRAIYDATEQTDLKVTIVNTESSI